MPPAGKLPDREIAALDEVGRTRRPVAGEADARRAGRHREGRREALGVPAGQRRRGPASRRRRLAQSHRCASCSPSSSDNGLSLSPPADKRTLIRRATFDLLGLPPTPEEVDAFVKDDSPDAYEKLIDRLLASPHYGERWGRHWLDVARYADTKGYVFFEEHGVPVGLDLSRLRHPRLQRRPALRPLRRSSNSPPTCSPPTTARPLAALGFLTLGGRFMNNTHDIIDDRIDVVTRGLLGLTVTLRPLPRSQVRSDPDGGLLLALRRLPQLGRADRAAAVRAAADTRRPPALRRGTARSARRSSCDFVTAKHTGLVNGARTRAAEYLLAAHAARNQPPADDFMLLADRGDLNPTMITRWRQYPRRHEEAQATRSGSTGTPRRAAGSRVRREGSRTAEGRRPAATSSWSRGVRRSRRSR